MDEEIQDAWREIYADTKSQDGLSETINTSKTFTDIVSQHFVPPNVSRESEQGKQSTFSKQKPKQETQK